MSGYGAVLNYARTGAFAFQHDAHYYEQVLPRIENAARRIPAGNIDAWLRFWDAEARRQFDEITRMREEASRVVRVIRTVVWC